MGMFLDFRYNGSANILDSLPEHSHVFMSILPPRRTGHWRVDFMEQLSVTELQAAMNYRVYKV